MVTNRGSKKLEIKGSIAVVVFDRARLLEKLFESLRNCIGIEKYSVIIVQQVNSELVEQVILGNSDLVDLHVRVDGSSRTTTENIAFNRYLATEIGFNSYQSNFVIGLEDDVEISRDALDFAEKMFLKYRNHRNFRGVNFGSQLPFSVALDETYTKLRYGVHGQAHLLPRATWENGNYSDVLKKGAGHYDGVVEHYLKTGFMITPNNSRYIDNGEFGSHMGGKEDSKYFQNLIASYVGKNPRTFYDYSEAETSHNWRTDCIPFRLKNQLEFKIKYLVWLNRRSRVIKKLILRLKGFELA